LVRLYKRVLFACVEQLWERGKQPLDSNSRNFDELAREKVLAGFGAERNRYNYHDWGAGG
jgi:hypothetical protein